VCVSVTCDQLLINFSCRCKNVEKKIENNLTNAKPFIITI